MPQDVYNNFQQARHPMLPRASPQEAERQAFAKSLKSNIQKKILPALEQVYDSRASRKFEKEHGHKPKNRHDIRRAMVKDAYFQAYAALNRISQELLWFSVIDSIENDYEHLADTAKTLHNGPGRLRTNSDMVPPKYVTALDIHCMPGGYGYESGDDPDFAAGALYDRGVYLYSMGYAGPYNDDKGRSVARYIKKNMPDFVPTHILDMGCAVGHSTLPYKEYFPDAELTGIDVTAPIVTYAHLRASGIGVDVNFEQMNAEETDYEDESFDLIVSHILLHETSGKALPRILKECHRLLKPGGYMIHADLPPFLNMNEFMRFILDNETYYNNEPFWGAMRELDLIELSAKAGFSKSDIRFDTAPMAIREYAGKSGGYDTEFVDELAEREFKAGEFAPGAGWEVMIARKEVA